MQFTINLNGIGIRSWKLNLAPDLFDEILKFKHEKSFT